MREEGKKRLWLLFSHFLLGAGTVMIIQLTPKPLSFLPSPSKTLQVVNFMTGQVVFWKVLLLETV